MPLSSDLVSQFVKVTSDNKKTKKETIIYGEVVVNGEDKYVKIDGSTTSIPIVKTADVKSGDRVMVMIKNHNATVLRNVSNQMPYFFMEDGEAKDVITKLQEYIDSTKDQITTEYIVAQLADLNTIKSQIHYSGVFNGDLANIDSVIAKLVESEYIEAELLKIYGSADFRNAGVYNLEAVYGEVDNLKANKLSVSDARITYANIDFSNIGKAAMEYFYANSGLIDNVTVNDGTITGHLVGVTIKGDLIEANTLVADKLVIQGEDGLYYKLNTDGETIESEQTEYNSLNGQIITAKSITATQISVSDLVAFDATIGGFNITENSIYSEVKDSEGNTTRGVYMDTDGQVNFGDSSNYIKYYRDEDGAYKLAISADTILYSINGDQHSLADLGVIGEYVKIGTYEDEPCIELGEKDSDFKLLITNTRMLFMEGSNVVAYVTNQSLYIQKAVIKEELQQGGFVWKARSNGNLGLIWKGDS